MSERPSALMMPEVTVWLQRERIADREHEVADFGLARIGERHLDQVLRRDLQHRDVGRLVARRRSSALICAVVEQRDGDFVGVLDHVRVGDDVAVLRIDDHARAGALELPLARRHVGRIEEAAEERILEQRIAAAVRAACRAWRCSPRPARPS